MANEKKTVEHADHKASVPGRLRGGERRIRRREESGVVTIKTVRQGLPTEVFKTLAANLEMSDRQLAGALKIPNRTLDRRLKEGVFSPGESDRLARVAKILKRAHEVFGNAEKAVPSAVIRIERNFVLNPHHADFAKVAIRPATKLHLDPRLWNTA